MERISSTDFLAWASTKGIVPWRPDSTSLIYSSDSGDKRFWNVPPRPPRRVVTLISHLLGGLDPWSKCFVWIRGGQWPAARGTSRIVDQVQLCMLAGAGITPGSEGAIVYLATEVDQLVTAMLAKLSFGCSVSDDLYIIPDHARQIIHTDHHDVVHVMASDKERMQQFIQHMESGKFLLSQDLPDETFKKPNWME